MLFRSYYEWLEQSGNPVFESRSLFDYRDIDNTLEDFLYYFQKKYLYGIPFDVIINKRYLLKHILDVYRSKSSIQGYKLLFRLIYNEDVDVYLPGRDILKASDGTWKEPRYLEVTNVDDIESLIGNEIIGASSGTIGVVEKIIKEPIDQNIICTVYLSNISPKGGNFLIGEKIYDIKYQNSTTLSNVIQNSPKILGSLDYIDIINGGDNFKIGDILKIIKRDISNNQLLTYGIDGVVKISSITRKLGALSYSVPYGGFGYTNNSLGFVYRNPTDTTGYGSSYSIGSIYNAKSIIYNTDIISDYMDVTLNSTAFGITGNTSSNLISTIGTTLSYSSNVFGSVAKLTNIKTGNAYTQVPYTFVKETLNSKNISGSLSYNTTSNTITGTSTNFTRYFTTNSVIYIQANATLNSTGEYHVIKNVVNTTSIQLYTSDRKSTRLNSSHT